MKAKIEGVVLIVLGFIVGIGVSQIHISYAAFSGVYNMDNRYAVSIDEIKQNFVFGDHFVDEYSREITLSDGTVHNIKLREVQRNGEILIELNDNGYITYMGKNGTTTVRNIMVDVSDVSEFYKKAKVKSN